MVSLLRHWCSGVLYETRGITEPNMVVGPSFAYGGLIQILSGMWHVLQ